MKCFAHVSADEPVVFGMTADPEPKNVVGYLNSQNAVAQSDASRPKTIDFLEM